MTEAERQLAALSFRLGELCGTAVRMHESRDPALAMVSVLDIATAVRESTTTAPRPLSRDSAEAVGL